MNIDLMQSLYKVKLEDGDILWVTVPEHTSVTKLSYLQAHLQKVVNENMGIDARVVIAAGKATVSVVKRNELSDIYQRLNSLEKSAEGSQSALRELTKERQT